MKRAGGKTAVRCYLDFVEKKITPVHITYMGKRLEVNTSKQIKAQHMI